MNPEIIKNVFLNSELQSSVKLIEIGFGEFQGLDLANDFYHLPFQLVSSGFERLMKCYICLGFHETNNAYPSSKKLKSCGGKGGHDLLALKKYIVENYFATHEDPELEEDLVFLTQDKDLEELIYLLSEFGKYSRYYNLDVVTSAEKPSINAIGKWKEYESGIISGKPKILEKLGNLETAQEALDYAQRHVLIKLEKFVRALCRQFTSGRLGTKALQNSACLYSFILIKDEELGNRNYRKETTRNQIKSRSPHIRTPADETQRRNNKSYRHTLVKKQDFQGDWPFYHDEVIVECREKQWCIVTIEGKDYALTGSAAGRYRLANPHDAGMAIIGKSIGPFTKMALELSEDPS